MFMELLIIGLVGTTSWKFLIVRSTIRNCERTKRTTSPTCLLAENSDLFSYSIMWSMKKRFLAMIRILTKQARSLWYGVRKRKTGLYSMVNQEQTWNRKIFYWTVIRQLLRNNSISFQSVNHAFSMMHFGVCLTSIISLNHLCGRYHR